METPSTNGTKECSVLQLRRRSIVVPKNIFEFQILEQKKTKNKKNVVITTYEIP